MKKPILVGLLLIGILAGFGVFYLASNLNSLVARLIEDNGSAVTETSVRVAGVDIELRDGRASIRDLKIASPDGFSTANVFELDDITVALDVASVREDPIVLDEVSIRAPVVHAEIDEEGRLNLDELRKRVQAHAGSGSPGGSADQKNVRIASFVFEQGRIELDATAIGVEKKTIELPAIRLNDVGGSAGAPPDEIASIILSTFAEQAGKQIARSEVQGLIEDRLGDVLGDEAKGLLDRLR